ncbi:MAG: protein kinase, partial [Myxococcales bacterium]|nr:protein kinase [Myxococcales bacterium]
DALAAFVERLLAKKPGQRPAGADAARRELEEIVPTIRDGLAKVTKVTSSLSQAPEATIDVTSDSTRDATRDLPDDATGAAPESLSPGSAIARYQVIRKLGAGAMGVVYLAYDRQLERNLAIKLMLPNAHHRHATARLVREARGLARLSHPNVVSIFDIGSHAGSLYIAMEYVPGQTLRKWLKAEPKPAWTETLAVLLQAGRGLAAIHAASLVHRDFKPDNVIVGSDGCVRVLDFGLVRVATPAFDMVNLVESTTLLGRRPGSGDRLARAPTMAEKLTRTGAIIGTPAYMALEQLAGDEVDALTDQFGFCVAAYEALFGKRPFVGQSLEELVAKMTGGELEAPAEDCPVPAGVHAALVRGLNVTPEGRWPDMSALIDALEAGAGDVALPSSPERDSATALRRRRLMSGIGGAAALSAALGLGVWIGSSLGDAGGEAEGAETMATERAESGFDPALAARNDELARMLALAQARYAVVAAGDADPQRRHQALRDAIEARGHDWGGEPIPPEVSAAMLAVTAELRPTRELAISGTKLVAAFDGAGQLATADQDGVLVLWGSGDDEDGAEQRLEGHEGPVRSLLFSDDGELLLSIGEDRRAHLWHPKTGTRLKSFEDAQVERAVFVPGSRDLVLATTGGTLERWALVRGRELERGATVETGGRVTALAFDREGARSFALVEGPDEG